MSLHDWQKLLEERYEHLKRSRASAGSHALFALEHGLSAADRTALQRDCRSTILAGSLSRKTPLPWIVYASELGYQYAGDEYWQTFTAQTPGWAIHGDRSWLRECFEGFARKYNGAVPRGPWAKHFSIICWPITHAILPKDLQRQLARILYDMRGYFTEELLTSPERLGVMIDGRSAGAPTRFQHLAGDHALIGQIASALLLHENGSTSSLIDPATLKRIALDLATEQAAREWLKQAQKLAAQRVQFKGLAAIRSVSAPRATPVEQAREKVAALAIEPRLLLRPLGADKWEVALELPDLSHLAHHFPSLKDVLTSSRCTIAGSDGRPVARGWFLHGPQQSVLRTWPKPGECLLRFERSTSQLDMLLRTECLLRPGPRWLFRIASDGLAYELRGLTIRPGGRYILVEQIEAPAEPPPGLRRVELTCAEVRASQFEIPDAVTPEVARTIDALGLSHAKSVRVRPAGLAAASWDGEGRAEWLSTERPCIAIQADHPLAAVSARVEGSATERIGPFPLPEGKPLFIELPVLPVGTHRLRISTREEDLNAPEDAAYLDLVVRAPRPWVPSGAQRTAFYVVVDPPTPTLEQVWDGAAAIEVFGPARRLAKATIHLITERHAASSPLELPSLLMPISAAAWRQAFEKVTSGQQSFENLLDLATACRVEIEAGELGKFTLECERAPSPFRWAVRRKGAKIVLALIDNTGDGPVSFTRCDFKTPDIDVPLEPTLFEHDFVVPSEGGLYLAMRGSTACAVVVAPEIKAFSALRVNPTVPDKPRGFAQGLKLVQLCEQWANAKPVGGVFARSMRREVARAVGRSLFSMVCGGIFGRAERELTREEGKTDILRLKQKVFSSAEVGLGSSLAQVAPKLAQVEPEKRVRALATILRQYLRLGYPAGSAEQKSAGLTVIRHHTEPSPNDPNWLAEFSLRLASAPERVRSWAGELFSPALNRLLEQPIFASASRFLVLAVEAEVTKRRPSRPGVIYDGWEWV